MLWNKIPKSVNIVFFLGGPGTGKGTICNFLEKNLNIYHLSVGQLLREVKVCDPEYLVIKKHMGEGSIVSSEISCRLIEDALITLNKYKIVIIDGFPRNFSNYYSWKKLSSSKMNLLKIFHLTCHENAMLNRCLSRNQLNSIKRLDDEANTIKSRISQYNNETLPLIQLFHENYPIETVDANRNLIEVQNDVLNRMKSLLETLDQN